MTLAKPAPSPITSAALDRHASLAMTRSLPHRHCEEAQPTWQSSGGASISTASPITTATLDRHASLAMTTSSQSSLRGICVYPRAQRGGAGDAAIQPAPGGVEGDSLSPVATWRVVNIGNSDKVRLLDYIEAIEDSLGKPAIRNYLPMQQGDVPAIWADASLLQQLTGYKPQTDFKQGVQQFVQWYREFYGRQ